MNTGMTKLIFSDSFDPIVDVGINIVKDSKHFTKQASNVFGMDYSELKPDKDHVGIHLVALGDSEHYGSNRNGDLFPKQACIDYHNTFVKNAKVFRHHKNQDKNKSIGEVKTSAYNEPMGRIELFIHAHKEKAAPELERLEKEGSIPFSMACARAGTLIITQRGTVPIEQIEQGDVVLTHTGSWKKVGNRSVRATEEYYEVNFVSWGRTTLGITGNHEVYAVTFDDVPRKLTNGGIPSKLFRRTHRSQLIKYAKWLPVSELTDKHYMLVPIDRVEDSDTDIRRARLLGYYIAEGSLGNGMTTFTCGTEDAAVTELSNLADWTSVTIKPRTNSDKAVDIVCFGTELQKDIEITCGRRGENKIIPMEIQHAGSDAKMNFMATWFNGDGWQDKNGLHWSTHYQNLAIDLQRLLASVDIPASCIRIDHPFDRGIVKSVDAMEYVISISNQYSDLFADISKAGILAICGTSKCRTFISGDYLCVPISSIELKKEKLKVYNFSVEGDESYTVYGLAVHNCRVPNDRCTICGNIRKSSSDPKQCSHVRDNLGDVFEDGKVVGTYNDEPNFFDISFVGRPADRIAWHLNKVATDQRTISSVDLAIEHGIVTPSELIPLNASGNRKYALCKELAQYENMFDVLLKKASTHTSQERYFIELTKAADVKLTDNDIEQLRNINTKLAFVKLAQNGIILDVDSFFKFAFGPTYGELASDIDGIRNIIRSNVFNNLIKTGDYNRICNNSYFDIDTENCFSYITGDKKINGFIKKLAGDISILPSMIDKRVIERTITGYEFNKIANAEINIPDNGISKISAELYTAYKLSALDGVIRFNPSVNKENMVILASVIC